MFRPFKVIRGHWF